MGYSSYINKGVKMKLVHKSSQRGLGTLEMLLMIVILAVLGGVGWYVYNSANKTKAGLDKITAVSNSSTAATPAAAAKTLTFKEYGVKITLPDSLKGLSYTAKPISNGDGTTSTSLFLNDAALAKSIDGCNTTKGSDGNFAALGKSTGQFPDEPTPDTGGLLKQFPAFYISSSYPNGIPCADDTKEAAVVAQMQALQNAMVEAFKTASLVE